jgi:hypothetical protein
MKRPLVSPPRLFFLFSFFCCSLPFSFLHLLLSSSFFDRVKLLYEKAIDEYQDWYVRSISAKIKAQFDLAHRAIVRDGVVSLGRVGDILIDFKEDVPDQNWLASIFNSLALGMYHTLRSFHLCEFLIL